MVFSVTVEVVEEGTKTPLTNASIRGMGVINVRRQPKPGYYKVFLETKSRVIICAPDHLCDETDWSEADRDESYLITLGSDKMR
jgi:hypothetical protein